MSFNIS